MKERIMSGKKSDIFEIVDENDRVIGTAVRSACHGNPALVHRVAHVLVFDPGGRLLLQKRSRHKDIQPGKWDTSVGGHLDPGEDYLQAARREMAEELGISGVPLTFLYKSRIRNEIESENVATYLSVYAGTTVRFAPDEIEEVRFWHNDEIEAALGSGLFTPNFEEEWGLFAEWTRRYSTSDLARTGFCAGDSLPDLFAALGRDGS
jgi:isopentenyl-diphosphate delta-isomerase type 1